MSKIANNLHDGTKNVTAADLFRTKLYKSRLYKSFKNTLLRKQGKVIPKHQILLKTKNFQRLSEFIRKQYKILKKYFVVV